jgi:hypothetical protein
MTGPLRDDLCRFTLISRRIHLRISNVSDKLQRKSNYTFYVQMRFPENRAVYEIMLKNMVWPDRPRTAI